MQGVKWLVETAFLTKLSEVIWLVETAFLNEAVLSNILLPPVANFGQSWLVTIPTFGMVF